MNDNINTNNNATATTPVTATTTAPTTTPETTKTRVIGSMQVGVDTSNVKFKSLAEMRRDFGDNWV